MLKLKVDLWASSMEVMSNIVDNKTGKSRLLRIVFDTGAYMTTIDTGALIRAGYNANKGKETSINVVGRRNLLAKEIILRGFELIDINGNSISLGPILVYATDMSDLNNAAILGLNVIKEFETKIKFGKQTIIEITPTYDINDLVKYENFSREKSRFGLWYPN